MRDFYRKFLFILIPLLALFFLNNYVFGHFLQNIFYNGFEKPGVTMNSKLSFFANFSRGFIMGKELLNANIKLQQENNLLQGDLAELENLRRENEFLRNQLGVTKRLNLQLVIVQIFNVQRGAASSTAFINKGSKDGIAKSMAVIGAGNVLVAIVQEVFDNSASILLIDDPRVKISGRVKDSKVLVNVEGGLANNLNINLVTADEEVKELNEIITSGLDGLPEALLIGKINKVGSPSGTLFKNVNAKPFLDLSLGSNLFVILSK